MAYKGQVCMEGCMILVTSTHISPTSLTRTKINTNSRDLITEMPDSLTTIGILGHTGRVGSQITKNLIAYQTQGLIRVIILHRPGSRISDLPPEVETRVIELEKDVPEDHFTAIKDLNVVMYVQDDTSQPPFTTRTQGS